MHEEFKFTVIISECIAAIFAAIYYYKYKDSGLQPLLIVLWYILANEILCQYFFALTKTGIFLYNLYDIIVPGSILYLIITQLKSTIRKKLVSIFLILCVVIFFISMFFTNPIQELSTTNFVIFTVAVIAALLLYFVELLKSDEVLNMKRNLFLWVALGFLVFFISFPVIILARDFISDGNEINRSLNYIQFTVAILSYLTIAFGFYQGEKIDNNNFKNSEVDINR